MARPCRGYTLVELVAAVAIGGLVVAALHSVVSLGLQAQASARGINELTYQARFALERMAAQARASPPRPLAVPPANTSGDVFLPVMYCVNGTGALIETTTDDAACSGTTAIASFVTAFSVGTAADGSAVDAPLVVLTLTLTQAAGGHVVSLATSVRLGGATL